MPLSKSLLWIFSSLLIVGGIATLILIVIHLLWDRKTHDPAYNIVAIIQSAPQREALSTNYLCELLHLSKDEQTNLHALDLDFAQMRLLESPLIKRAKVQKLFPGTLFIDYSIRTPFCLLYDYENIALDREGYLFPILPYFTPKRLPEVYLGLLPFGVDIDEFDHEGGAWNVPLQSKEARLALKLIEQLDEAPFRLLRLDVSRAYVDSFGKREIVLIIEDVQHLDWEENMVTYVSPRILRLSTENYLSELKRYERLRQKLLDDSLSHSSESKRGIVRGEGAIVDLRLPELAFIKVNR